MDAFFSVYTTNSAEQQDQVHVDFLVAGPRKIWLDGGICVRAAVPNTLRAVCEKHPKFLNQLANKCVVLWPGNTDTCIEVQRVVTQEDSLLPWVQTTRISVRVVELMEYLESLP